MNFVPGTRETIPRHGRLLGGICVALLAAACSDQPTEPPLPMPPPHPISTIDFDPAWSSDGNFIAFHRSVPSSLGPPGVYEIPAAGGQPRFVTIGDWAWPASLRYSPDGTQLLAGYAGQVFVIDVQTGDKRQLTFTDNFAGGADWSPDGQHVVYARGLLPAGEDPDSAGIWLHTIGTGEERPIRGWGNPLDGGDTRWSAAANLIAFARAEEIYTIRPDGSELRRISTAPAGLFHDLPRWVFGDQRILYRESGGTHQANWIIDPANGSQIKWPLFVGLSGAFSPDDQYVVIPAIDPSDSTRSRAVLFVQDFDDFTGSTQRQLTFYAPPDSAQETIQLTNRRQAAPGSSAEWDLSPSRRPGRRSSPVEWTDRVGAGP